MRRQFSEATTIVVAAIVLLPIIYFGSFYALLDHRPYVVSGGTVYPTYKLGGELSKVIYAPAYELYLLWDRICPDEFPPEELP